MRSASDSSELSLGAAALGHASQAALISQGQTFSFAQLAEQCSAIHLPTSNLHRARPGLSTALLLYKSLEDRRALCLLPAGASDADFADLKARLPQNLHREIALVLLTSGSAGRAKAVKLSRRALLASAISSRKALGWQDSDRWLCTLPLSHVGGLSILLRCLVDRKTVVLHDHFDAAQVAESIVRERITHISLVPTMLWRLLTIGAHPPSHLRVTLMGGSALDPDLARRARDVGFLLRESYGMTESAAQIITDGRALEGVKVRIRDRQLDICGPMMMSGYLAPDEPSELAQGEWFRTHDRAVIDDSGKIKILGRADEVIISGGENIDPRAVEAGLNRCLGIAESYALGLPHAEWGHELVALVVPRNARTGSQELGAHELKGHLRPKRLIRVTALPLLETGKIDRAKARRLAQRAAKI